MREGFKVIEGFKEYFINDAGEIRNRSWKKLKGGKCKDGYKRINLYTGKGKYKTRYIHRLVAANFIGPIPDGWEVNHNNGDILDNSKTNLEIVEKKDNLLHQINVIKSNSKINYQIAQRIRAEYRKGGTSYAKLGNKYGISSTQVSRIVNNTRWTKDFHE